MKVLKGALLLLLLAVANAKPDPDQCQVLKMLAEDNLQPVLGDWVLVWSVWDHQEGRDILRNLSSSRVEMRLQEDSQTLMFSERNRFSDKFINYYINISMELLHNPNQAMHPIEGKMEVDGVLVPYNETGYVNFYETCPNCMRIVFKISRGVFVLNYRKEGHHQDVDHMKADHDNHRKMAECLGIDDDQPYIYDGVADAPQMKRQQTNCPLLLVLLRRPLLQVHRHTYDLGSCRALLCVPGRQPGVYPQSRGRGFCQNPDQKL
ncbi:saxitoxin and tetrodotoxin-binding protein 1-like [Gymnodraco acuticeps]|uniref:Saxitoxin and tetrodotoxin-binding protein 1-like n=1 Tax=Gymnodraco acuticeps TaxID=8218 RepID=A0A6P8VSU5_GYMAC|nr:saxitoxin and tetrodotoxin-binding protein 1-like [Gymnodraco acuticeps]